MIMNTHKTIINNYYCLVAIHVHCMTEVIKLYNYEYPSISSTLNNYVHTRLLF